MIGGIGQVMINNSAMATSKGSSPKLEKRELTKIMPDHVAIFICGILLLMWIISIIIMAFRMWRILNGN